MCEKSFGARFCRLHCVSPDHFEKVLLKETLYPHARWLYPLISLISPDHFDADLDLIRDVAKLTRLRDFSSDVQSFVHHPANMGASRRTFNLRLSTKQLRRVVRATLHNDKTVMDHDETAVPFARLNKSQQHDEVSKGSHPLVA